MRYVGMNRWETNISERLRGWRLGVAWAAIFGGPWFITYLIYFFATRV